VEIRQNYTWQAMNGGPIHFLQIVGEIPKPKVGKQCVCCSTHNFCNFRLRLNLQKCLPGSIPDPLNYLVTELIVKLASPSACVLRTLKIIKTKTSSVKIIISLVALIL